MRHDTFDTFLMQKYVDSGRCDGMTKDQCEVAFEAWVADVDGAMMAQYAQEYGDYVAGFYKKD